MTGESPDSAIEAFALNYCRFLWCFYYRLHTGNLSYALKMLVSSLMAASPNTGATCPCNHFGNHDPSPLHLPSPFSGFSVSCARQHLESKDPQCSAPDGPTCRKFFEATAYTHLNSPSET